MEEFSFDATQFSIDGRPRFLVATFTKNWDKFPTNSRDDSCFHHFGYILSDKSTNCYRLQHGRIDEKYMNTSVDFSTLACREKSACPANQHHPYFVIFRNNCRTPNFDILLRFFLLYRVPFSKGSADISLETNLTFLLSFQLTATI